LIYINFLTHSDKENIWAHLKVFPISNYKIFLLNSKISKFNQQLKINQEELLNFITVKVDQKLERILKLWGSQNKLFKKWDLITKN